MTHNSDHRIYVDHAATTAVDPRVVSAMLPFLTQAWGNPSSIYAEAREARKGLDAARRTVAEILGAKPNEIVFTSGGTESDNLALRGVVAGARKAREARGITSPPHVITTQIEHHAVLHAAEALDALTPARRSHVVQVSTKRKRLQANIVLERTQIAEPEVPVCSGVAGTDEEHCRHSMPSQNRRSVWR